MNVELCGFPVIFNIQFFLEPMARNGDDPLGSMGSDTPIAVLSKRPKLIYEYFKKYTPLGAYEVALKDCREIIHSLHPESGDTK